MSLRVPALAIAADPKHLGARIGIIAVVHTWDSALTHHPHVHSALVSRAASVLHGAFSNREIVDCEASGAMTSSTIVWSTRD